MGLVGRMGEIQQNRYVFLLQLVMEVVQGEAGTPTEADVMVLVAQSCRWRVDGQVSVVDRLGKEAAFPWSLGRSNGETDVVIGRFLLGSTGGEPIFRARGEKRSQEQQREILNT
ncbi:hypothetical protein CRENBAI_001894 [Crenichthys baileyi]|uniref:Uncharacterized protein n=1 Tax=Crenichthys baileyi TaxID=28760 RepID=A0AAV9SNR7_9TELE